MPKRDQLARIESHSAATKSVPLRFLIIDDHPIVLAGIKQFLQQAFPNARFGEAQDGEAGLRLARAEPWDVVLLDVALPGRGGVEVLRSLRDTHPALPVLVLSVHPERLYARMVLEAGADGYLTKAAAPDELARAVRTVLNGECYVSHSLTQQLAEDLRRGARQLPARRLSAREAEVLRLIASGLHGKEVAAQLRVSEKTVSTYRLRILAKLNLSNTAELIRYAAAEGALV